MMIAKFSNGFELEIISALESKSQDSISTLSLDTNSLIDVDHITDEIKDGLDEIEIKPLGIKFNGYTRLISIQNIISESGVQANIRLSKGINNE